MLVIAVAGFSVVGCTEDLNNHFSPNALIPTMLGALTVAILASLYSRWSGRVQSLGLDFVNFWRRRVSGTRRSQADAWPLPSSSELEANVGPPSNFDDGRTPRRVGHRLAAATMLPGLLVLMPAGLVAAGSLLADFDTAADAVNGTIFHPGLRLFQVAGMLSIGVSLGALILDPLGRRRGGLTSF
ncbi:hypothetical protein E4U57_001373 [Claviceps arundinis]|uniref:Uncharacterized protein n=1 Tax=Claviceps arundinis TaxID=1623583 RepID=A0A9P7MXY7_9HYPO|nr:hypothetical protein E4U57_001373 [Claviceps arundinis]KAG5976114.1 hypothetical protein E4U56_002456 [Claviceps arundinis]